MQRTQKIFHVLVGVRFSLSLYIDKQEFILFSVHPFQTDALLMHMPG